MKVMKKQINNFFANINRATLNNLTTIVNETLVIDATKEKRAFTPAELWRIHSCKRTIYRRRDLIQ